MGGQRVMAQTSMGFWIRGSVLKRRADGSARIRFGDFESPPWLPRIQGFGSPEEWVGPERLAPLPDRAPSEPPPSGADVIALWDKKRFHYGTVAAVEGTGKRARIDVAFTGMETLSFGVTEVLPVGAARPKGLKAARARGLELGDKVLMLDGSSEVSHAGWVARLGTAKVYVRFPKASHGHWLGLDRIKKGGSAKPRRPPTRSKGELASGAGVIARWTDGQLYPGVAGEVKRGRWGREVNVHYDDGTVRWTPEARVWVTRPAAEPVPQRRKELVLPEEKLEPGRVVAALATDGCWRKGTVEARRGTVVWVAFDEVPTKKGNKRLGYDPVWASGRRLAFAPDPEARELPARRAAVVAVKRRKKRHGYELLTFAPGRAKAAIGDRLTVDLDEGATLHAVFEDVWVRDDLRVAEGTTLEVGAQVLVERRPGESNAAELKRVGRKKRRGQCLVHWSDGGEDWVHAARLQPVPEPPPPPPPPPPEPEPLPPPEPEDPRRAVLVQLLSRWTGGAGYRDGRLGALLDDDERGARLPVDVGLLTVRFDRGGAPRVSVVAATGDAWDPLPPPDPALVRLAGWVKGLLSGPVDPEAAKAADAAWARDTFDVPAGVERAGGALSVRFRCDDWPRPGQLERWARATHTRLFDPEP